MDIREELIARSTEYFKSIEEIKDEVPSPMLIDFVIEKYAQHRNYPKSFDEEKINKDMESHITTMAMAVVDLFMKSGAEGEKSHSENGISRTYENACISSSVFNDVLPFVKSL